MLIRKKRSIIIYIIHCMYFARVGECINKNVLFLVSDDMRPEIGAYNALVPGTSMFPGIKTPSLDSLAKRGLLLKNSYVQQAVCSPSRTSLLTGRRPDTTHVTELTAYFRQVGGNFTTLPQYFKDYGYTTVGVGKIFHPGMASGNNDPISWSEPYIHTGSYWEDQTHKTWRAIPDEKLKSHPLEDMMIAQKAAEMLRKFAPSAKQGKPFFIAAGFHRPHLPIVIPQSFLDLYPINKIKLPDNPYAPHDLPKIAWSDYDELWKYTDVNQTSTLGDFNTTLSTTLTVAIRRAYYAAVSYVDSLVGDLLRTLEELNLTDSTIISFWGDHGWQLGEHSEWCKHTVFDLATRAPMIISIPGLTDQGIVTQQLTEFVDLYPTLVQAAGLPQVPLCAEDNATRSGACTEGVSVIPLIHDPARQWKQAVFSQYPRMSVDGDVIMGYSMKTHRYRYTEWVKYRTYPTYLPLWDQVFKGSVELYDHAVDQEENNNLAHNAGTAQTVKELSQILHQGWRKQIPTLQEDIVHSINEQH